MYYFINNNITVKQSGIGHAQLKRLELFKKYKQPAKLMTTDYNRFLSDALAAHNLKATDIVNLFDFFGGTETVSPRKFGIDDFHFPSRFDVKKIDDHYDVTENGRLNCRIVMRKDKPDWVESATYFDAAKRIIQGDFWDSRGFRALQQLYDRDGHIRVRRLLTANGEPFYESYHYGKKFDANDTTLCRLINYHGTDWEFNGVKELTQFFLDELVKRDRARDEDDVFISDASLADAWALVHMRQPAFKVMHLHNNHSNNSDDVMHGGLNFNYEYSLNNFNQWQGIIAPTASQAEDVAKRFGDRPKTYVVPVGIVPDTLMALPKQPFDKRQPGKIVQIARLSHEKRIDHAIKVMAKVVKEVPNATLDIYGYANDDSGKIAKKLVRDLQLQKVVSFKGYTTDMDAVYNGAQLSILTSSAEGLPLSLIEAQSHGLPLVSYDINYGPRDIINDGKDGYLIKSGDIDGMAAAVVKLMTDDSLRARFSDAAYQARAKYSEESVWQYWQQLDKDARQFFDKLKEAAD